MYDICFNLPEEVKRKLPLIYIKILSSPIRTKNFCEFSSIDAKLRFFHAIGLKNSLAVYPTKVKTANGVKDLLATYDEEKLAAASKGSASLGIFVTTDKQTAFMINLMAQTVHSDSYALNLDYNKVGYHIKKWSKRIDTGSQKDLEDCQESAKVIANIMLETSKCMNTSELLFELKSIDITVLMFFYEKMHVYLHRDNVILKFDIHFQRRMIVNSVKRLHSEEFITKHPTDTKYTIGGKGIDLVNRFLNRVIKANNF